VALQQKVDQLQENYMATAADVKAKLDALTAQVADENTQIAAMGTFIDNLDGQLAALKTAAANAEIPQEIMDEIDALSTAVSTGKTAITAKITTPTA
jgi:chromosome segregation ATPase